MNHDRSGLPSTFLGRLLYLGTGSPILTAFAALQVSVLVFLGSIHLATLADPASGASGAVSGDFAAFFTGAVMVREGFGSDLYNLDAQMAVQTEELGGSRPFWQPYLNPPALAMALAPATDLGYVNAFRIFAALQFLLLLAALSFMNRVAKGIAEARHGALTAILLTLGYLPLATTIFGGQNPALTLALLWLIYIGVRLQRPILAGIALGLLTYKPQYALIVAVVLLLRRQFKVLAFGALVCGAIFILAAVACGPWWPADYWAMLADFAPLEMAENHPWHFSLPAVVDRILPGWSGTAIKGLGILAVLGLIGASGRGVAPDSDRFPAFFGMAVCAAMLLSPHLQYYEIGILTMPAILAVDNLLARGVGPAPRTRFLLVVGYLAYPAWRLSEAIGVQPLFFILAACFLWCHKLAAAATWRA